MEVHYSLPASRRRYKGGYERLHGSLAPTRERLLRRRSVHIAVMVLSLTAIAAFLVSGSLANISILNTPGSSCDSVQHGYQCQPEISHFWGQYSPFYSVDSAISSDVPPSCSITFAQILSRHGARDPTATKTKVYNATIQKVHANAKAYPDKYAFLADYQYSLGTDQLTLFGQQEMINSGAMYYERYEQLASHVTPFIRTASEARVVQSAQNWTQGFHKAKVDDKFNVSRDSAYPYPMVVISEADGSNNTLSHGLCTAFEDGPDSSIASKAQSTWAKVFIPPIQSRLNSDLQGANLTITETVYMMDMCPFNTVASRSGDISPFCALFSEEEWHQYSYYQTLNKYYGYGNGNPLGPTQGVGFTNELIARMTNQPVEDHTSTNHTLDDDPATFPLRRQLYADFSHDNDMTAIFSAVGLYEEEVPLSNTTLTEAPQANGYSATWTVPFAARAYFEKMECTGSKEELVRVIINDRVLPLTQCGGDRLGRCTLSRFVDSLSFAMGGGRWDQCFA
ncbi:related to 3-phytase A precursor [Ramularia collo-cygni]|uniref:Phytase A n=1 Tax=Ramularia collo-cygni TaxID=112498 RepID=A0A2D3V6U0_9PEZI|nr:related to 3-phytase A precursor [Ramularia collo-cygni]CZT20437.1 related to 3-phytase A precursor [Ramularia collo-cygni]